MEKLVPLLGILFSFWASTSAAICSPPFESVGDHCYYFDVQPTAWTDARDFCQLFKGGDLAVFDVTCEDYVEVFRRASEIDPNNYWLGASDEASEGVWMWVDGRPVDLSKPYWSLGEPLTSTSSNCVFMSFESDNRWRLTAYPCSSGRSYICQTGIVQTSKNSTVDKEH